MILSGLGIYAALSAITYLLFQEFSFRHSIFLLVVAFLSISSSALFERKRMYLRSVGLFSIATWSLLLIRLLIDTATRIWDVDTYMTFCFAIVNFILLVVAAVKQPFLKQCIGLLGFLVIFISVLAVWGYFFIANSWISAAAGLAIVQTNFEEAVSYILNMLPVYTCIGVAFLVVCSYYVCRYSSNLSMGRLSPGKIAAVAFLCILNVVLLVRTHDNFLYNIYEETKNSLTFYESFNKSLAERKARIATDVKFASTGEKGIFVLVIGESENRDHMSAYGYHRKTTPWLEENISANDAFIFDRAYSCFPQTVQALTYALSEKNQYNDKKIEDSLSIIEAAKAAGYKTVWLSNQVRYGAWDNPVSVIGSGADQQIWINNHMDSFDMDVYDGNLVDCLDEIEYAEKTLIVAHLMGSHLSYSDRCPKELSQFSGNDRYVDGYDDSVYYTDYVLNKFWEKLKDKPGFQAMLYFSDHGEAIDEDASHGVDNFMFSMVRIPLVIFVSENYRANNPDLVEALYAHRSDVFTNDLIYDAMLGIMSVRVDNGYEAENDISSSSYDADSSRFLTLYGERKIVDE